jgi:hypothetical protein
VPTACLDKGGCTELTDIYRQETTAFTEEPKGASPGNGHIFVVGLGCGIQRKRSNEILSEHSALHSTPNRCVSALLAVKLFSGCAL